MYRVNNCAILVHQNYGADITKSLKPVLQYLPSNLVIGLHTLKSVGGIIVSLISSWSLYFDHKNIGLSKRKYDGIISNKVLIYFWTNFQHVLHSFADLHIQQFLTATYFTNSKHNFLH